MAVKAQRIVCLPLALVSEKTIDLTEYWAQVFIFYGDAFGRAIRISAHTLQFFISVFFLFALSLTHKFLCQGPGISCVEEKLAAFGENRPEVRRSISAIYWTTSAIMKAQRCIFTWNFFLRLAVQLQLVSRRKRLYLQKLLSLCQFQAGFRSVVAHL